MFTVIGMFIKEKVLSTAGIFILIFVVIFGVFTVYNSDTILSKFGFETKTTLKGALVKSQDDLITVTDINKNLNQSIDQLEKRKDKELKVVVDNANSKAKVREVIYTAKEKLDDKNKAVNFPYVAESETTDTTYKMLRVPYDTLSSNNIESLNEVYSTLFEGK